MSTWTLYKREIASYFQSLIAYTLLGISAFIIGLIFWSYADGMSRNGSAPMSLTHALFKDSVFFFIILLIQVPLVTMRVFSEEFKMGTIEMLLTAPVSEWSIVIAKFLGALTFFLLLWSPYVLDFITLQTFSSPPPPIAWSELLTTATTLVLIGSFYISLGVFTSVLTRNQIVAAIICFALLFGALICALLAQEFASSDYGTLGEKIASYFSVFNHLDTGSAGILDTRPFVFYITASILMLFCTQRILLAHRLQG